MTIARSGPAAAIEIRGITKIFGEQRALDRVDLSIAAGEIHALLGENGSGKSTLIKILSGLYEPDAGTLAIHGTPVALPLTATRASAAGVEFVHQDLGLIPALSVAENFALGAISSGEVGAFTSDRALQREASRVLAEYDVTIDAAATVSTLAPVERALLAIVRAIHSISMHGGGAQGILVLDEPTVFLPRGDVDRVFALVRRLAAGGCAVIIVSHDLDEVIEVSDAFTVLRDGVLVGTKLTAEVTRDELIELIVGRAVDLVTRPPARTIPVADRPALVIEALESGDLHDVTFSLERGEILGLTGLAGSGYERVPYAIYGASTATGGTLTLADGIRRPLSALSERRARGLGIGLLPSDRRNTAGIGSLDIVDNVTMLRLGQFRGVFGLKMAAMRADGARLVERFDVRPRDPAHLFGTLSGGNQQKALLGKWLAVEPAVLLIDEPTQGVDIGARSQIFDILREAADSGVSIICTSTDHEQLAVLTDRTIVFDHGTIRTELRGAELSKQSISEACLGATTAESTDPALATEGSLS